MRGDAGRVRDMMSWGVAVGCWANGVGPKRIGGSAGPVSEGVAMVEYEGFSPSCCCCIICVMKGLFAYGVVGADVGNAVYGAGIRGIVKGFAPLGEGNVSVGDVRVRFGF